MIDTSPDSTPSESGFTLFVSRQFASIPTSTELINPPPPPRFPLSAPNPASGTSASKDGEPLDASTIARNIAALKARQKAAARQKGAKGVGGKSGTDTESNAGSE